MDIEHAIQCGAPHTIAKLVQITSITFGFMILTPIVNGGYKPTYNWGAPHCMVFTAFFYSHQTSLPFFTPSKTTGSIDPTVFVELCL